MDNISIKRAQLDDIAAVSLLFDAYRQFYEQQPNAEFAKQFISDRLQNNESIIFIAQNQFQQALGFCQIYPTFCSVIAAPIYILSDLFVSPDARKSGIGKMLLEQAYTHAKDNKIARMDLTTAKNNFTAQSLYESLGWKKDTIFFAYNKTITV